MMLCNIPVRRTALRGWPPQDPSRETPSEAFGERGGRRSNRPGNSQAKGPRSGDELLESEAVPRDWSAASTEGVIRQSSKDSRGNLSGPMTEGLRSRGRGLLHRDRK